LRGGRVTQIVGGSLLYGEEGVVTNFTSDLSSSAYAEMYRKDGLVGGHVIKLGPEAENDLAALQALEAYPGGLQIGGGINSENARKWIEAGASQVIVTSFVFKEGKINLERLNSLVDEIGKEKLVLDLSCRRDLTSNQYYVVTDRWTKFTDYVVDEAGLKFLSDYCSEFLVHGVDVEGKQQGIEEELVEILGKYTSIPTTYAGGVRNLEDMDRIHNLSLGKVNVTVGSALDIFGGNLPYSSVLEWHRQKS
jgi:phosphoribosylformimino-5-aminoimidazole carboxamide ribotide isomerase